jgi:hypothetical protein
LGLEPLEMLWFGRAPTAEQRGTHDWARALNLPFWIQKLGDLNSVPPTVFRKEKNDRQDGDEERADFLPPFVSSPVSYFTKSISR